MAKNLTVVQLGAQPQVITDKSFETAGDLMKHLGLENASVKVAGETVDADYVLSDYDFVSFGEKVKGGI